MPAGRQIVFSCNAQWFYRFHIDASCKFHLRTIICLKAGSAPNPCVITFIDIPVIVNTFQTKLQQFQVIILQRSPGVKQFGIKSPRGTHSSEITRVSRPLRNKETIICRHTESSEHVKPKTGSDTALQTQFCVQRRTGRHNGFRRIDITVRFR